MRASVLLVLILCSVLLSELGPSGKAEAMREAMREWPKAWAPPEPAAEPMPAFLVPVPDAEPVPVPDAEFLKPEPEDELNESRY